MTDDPDASQPFGPFWCLLVLVGPWAWRPQYHAYIRSILVPLGTIHAMLVPLGSIWFPSWQMTNGYHLVHFDASWCCLVPSCCFTGTFTSILEPKMVFDMSITKTRPQTLRFSSVYKNFHNAPLLFCILLHETFYLAAIFKGLSCTIQMKPTVSQVLNQHHCKYPTLFALLKHKVYMLACWSSQGVLCSGLHNCSFVKPYHPII